MWFGADASSTGCAILKIQSVTLWVLLDAEHCTASAVSSFSIAKEHGPCYAALATLVPSATVWCAIWRVFCRCRVRCMQWRLPTTPCSQQDRTQRYVCGPSTSRQESLCHRCAQQCKGLAGWVLLQGVGTAAGGIDGRHALLPVDGKHRHTTLPASWFSGKQGVIQDYHRPMARVHVRQAAVASASVVAYRVGPSFSTSTQCLWQLSCVQV